jgi:hypothetical protein
MPNPALFAESRTSESSGLPAQGFDRLQELMRHGYVPDSRPIAGGLLLRHQFAPDLILKEDGSVDVPLGQRLKLEPVQPAAPRRRKRRWFRGLLILIGLALYTMLAFAIIAGLMESM